MNCPVQPGLLYAQYVRCIVINIKADPPQIAMLCIYA